MDKMKIVWGKQWGLGFYQPFGRLYKLYSWVFVIGYLQIRGCREIEL